MASGGKPDDEVRQAILAPASAAVIAPTSSLGALRFGRYDVVASIGRGGMGEIYLARANGAGSGAGLVALKVLLDEDGRDHELIGMFMDEASIMAQIHHPNVLAVIDFGRERGSYYLAMEYLQGRPLVRVMIDAYVTDDGMDPRTIAAIGADAARGLDAAHSAKDADGRPLRVVHRDVSPQNIFVTYDGISKVIDFGVARAAQRISETTAGQLKGKAAYMSPEQVSGRSVDGRSDIFSLGACLWEMAAGRRLFKRPSDYDTMAAVLDGEIRPPSEYRKDVDRELDRIILKALERDPARRISSGADLSARLSRYVEKRSDGRTQGTARALMERLYGDAAREERSLIEMLARRSATDREVDALRQLSGISPRSNGRLAMTLAGRPEELEQLDDFGREEEMPTLTLESRPGGSLRIIEPGAKARGALVAPDQRSEHIRKAVEALQAEHRAALAQRPGHLATAQDSAAASASRRYWRWVPQILVAAIVVLGIAAAFLAAGNARERKRSVEKEQPTSQVPDRSPREAVQPVAGLLPAPEVDADVVRPALAARGLDVTGIGGKLVIGDGAEQEAVYVSDGARFTEVASEAATGWLASSSLPGGPSVVWIGAVRGGPWRARAMSINDCPAKASVQPTGIEIAYGGQRQVLPHGGGPLETVTLPRPEFATRLEILPIGVAFGEPRLDRPATLCGTGLQSERIELRRVPPGRYTLLWTGSGRADEVPLVVEASPSKPSIVPSSGTRPRSGAMGRSGRKTDLR